MTTDAAPWPRLLACWQEGRLRTLLLHADGRRAHLRDEPAVDGAQLAPALADALAGLHRTVHHAVLVTDAEMATDELRRRLGLTTLCSVSLARALRLAPQDPSSWTGAAHALHLSLHTPATGAVCAQIRAAYDRLTRSERRVADVVLANPGAALDTATARLAEAADVSQPQVIRFCRALGFDGVKTLKRALAESLVSPNAGSEAPTGHPLLTRSLNALCHVDRSRLAAAAQLLTGARQIDVLADAARAPLLDLALLTLWRLGLPARPVQAGERPSAAVCLALGTAAPGAGILITEAHQPGVAALQLVTGAESPAAPTLLAMLMLQLLLAELAPAPGPSPPATSGRRKQALANPAFRA
ncbi:MurR/RpiR family transcriptional regulator [Roseateles sp. P5_E7]